MISIICNCNFRTTLVKLTRSKGLFHLTQIRNTYKPNLNQVGKSYVINSILSLKTMTSFPIDLPEKRTI